MPRLVQPLADGPLDLIGDVHGELEALQELLHKLGYEADGTHPQGRSLVFLGDLVDRGPDSAGVVELIRPWVASGQAQCVCGNHELNLLLGKHRKGNQWFYGEKQTIHEDGIPVPQILADSAIRADLVSFFATLPLALERRDLVVTHACWQPMAIDRLRGLTLPADEAFLHFEQQIEAQLLERKTPRPSIEAGLALQNENPVGVCTSGIEQPTETPFEAGGKPRYVERVAWWSEWPSGLPDVAFGHYWRAVNVSHQPVHRGPYLFPDCPVEEPLGPGRNAWCVDLSAGYRNQQRAVGQQTPPPTALAALRWPERKIVQVNP
ncbi:MAG: metallophosphoesterase [Planctomycetes bacterium]|jgi:hypothetical protein|nr:metallophosphoesterase [Planctomycetota bacterium]MBT5101590.1 metallophosphoesterase [Planctomycetota bacterium]MBT7317802.1 metallophosphoesterase [Planctomycetota bacterium]